MSSRLASSLLKRARERQSPPARSPRYQPLIKATRAEAPASSRPTLLYSTKLQRHVHLLSTPELTMGALALYHPDLFELQEQRAMHPIPTSHPLDGFLEAGGISLSPLLGTLHAAERIGCLELHAVGTIDLTGGARIHVPLPYSSDLVLFMQDSEGPYCIVWSIKQSTGDHGRPWPGDLRAITDKSANKRTQFRDRLEEAYYQSAHIPLKRIAASQIEERLAANLISLAKSSGQETVPIDMEGELLRRLVDVLDSQITPLQVCEQFAKEKGIDASLCHSTYRRMIWQRQLSVDLFDSVTIDEPKRSQTVDPLQAYAEFFRRGGC